MTRPVVSEHAITRYCSRVDRGVSRHEARMSIESDLARRLKGWRSWRGTQMHLPTMQPKRDHVYVVDFPRNGLPRVITVTKGKQAAHAMGYTAARRHGK